MFAGFVRETSHLWLCDLEHAFLVASVSAEFQKSHTDVVLIVALDDTVFAFERLEVIVRSAVGNV